MKKPAAASAPATPGTRAEVAAWLDSWEQNQRSSIAAALNDPQHLNLASRIDAACHRRLSTPEAGDRVAPVVPPPL